MSKDWERAEGLERITSEIQKLQDKLKEAHNLMMVASSAYLLRYSVRGDDNWDKVAAFLRARGRLR